jgi:cobyrinic acid a,c-diamide synthase
VNVPAVIVAGSGSGCGKTTVALAIMAALVRRGYKVQPFKTGPDFLDPGHHRRITGRIGRNLDTWLQTPDVLARTYLRGSTDADFVVIEGVMGLFDGASGGDSAGSTADLARKLNLPVVLVVDGRGIARSIAPLIHGFKTFDRSVEVAAVVVNRVGSLRHYERYLAPAIGEVPGVLPIGYLSRDAHLEIPSRHLGLRSAIEIDRSEDSSLFDRLADAAEATINLEALLALGRSPDLAGSKANLSDLSLSNPDLVDLSRSKPKLFSDHADLADLSRSKPDPFDLSRSKPDLADVSRSKAVLSDLSDLSRSKPDLADLSRTNPDLDARRFRVALAYDRAFQFYYEDNLDDLRDQGAEIVCFSPLDDESLPDRIDLLYLGGGYPELYGATIAGNLAMRESIRRFHAEGGAILAECGGMMACCRAIEDADGNRYDGWGLIPVTTVMRKRFAALGYVTIETAVDTLYGPRGTKLRGHEFHYSTLVLDHAIAPSSVLNLLRPDEEPRNDGFRIGGLLAGYAHAYFGSNPAVPAAIARFAAGGRSLYLHTKVNQYFS